MPRRVDPSALVVLAWALLILAGATALLAGRFLAPLIVWLIT